MKPIHKVRLRMLSVYAFQRWRDLICSPRNRMSIFAYSVPTVRNISTKNPKCDPCMFVVCYQQDVGDYKQHLKFSRRMMAIMVEKSLSNDSEEKYI